MHESGVALSGEYGSDQRYRAITARHLIGVCRWRGMGASMGVSWPVGLLVQGSPRLKSILFSLGLLVWCIMHASWLSQVGRMLLQSALRNIKKGLQRKLDCAHWLRVNPGTRKSNPQRRKPFKKTNRPSASTHRFLPPVNTSLLGTLFQ
jgi:hypothetical protein